MADIECIINGYYCLKFLIAVYLLVNHSPALLGLLSIF